MLKSIRFQAFPAWMGRLINSDPTPPPPPAAFDLPFKTTCAYLSIRHYDMATYSLFSIMFRSTDRFALQPSKIYRFRAPFRSFSLIPQLINSHGCIPQFLQPIKQKLKPTSRTSFFLNTERLRFEHSATAE